MYRKFIPLFVLTIMTGAARAQQPGAMNWLAGSWKISTANGVITENWTVVNDSTLAGNSYFTPTGKDSVLQETLSLEYRQGSWTYIPIVARQNNGQPVRFPVTFTRSSEFIAENPAHDFPQRIAYRRIGDAVFASIEGRRNGQYRKQNFDFSAR